MTVVSVADSKFTRVRKLHMLPSPGPLIAPVLSQASRGQESWNANASAFRLEVVASQAICAAASAICTSLVCSVESTLAMKSSWSENVTFATPTFPMDCQPVLFVYPQT